jgi:hypothetical protein
VAQPAPPASNLITAIRDIEFFEVFLPRTRGIEATGTARLSADCTDHFGGGKAGLLIFYLGAIRPI